MHKDLIEDLFKLNLINAVWELVLQKNLKKAKQLLHDCMWKHLIGLFKKNQTNKNKQKTQTKPKQNHKQTEISHCGSINEYIPENNASWKCIFRWLWKISVGQE